MLTHYDPTKEIVIAADASEHGIGAVISHRFSDGKEKAIHHACRSLTAAEKNYGQVEKGALAVVFALRMFHRYIYGIYGRYFKLLTDHKPLITPQINAISMLPLDAKKIAKKHLRIQFCCPEIRSQLREAKEIRGRNLIQMP
ncbi:hypothetical protein TELCIR_24465 [Teladorsagia circumcincta]|uniref:Reverse transcriptase RNase H-like domain-containing protein n=1 Tax=Teladorsagia circumcincta TaxID=45464 RepID=A0A2G9T881_TELCI|nr:hypothetical protein TELCIR_24465 [Teladorsagia circumcincta]